MGSLGNAIEALGFQVGSSHVKHGFACATRTKEQRLIRSDRRKVSLFGAGNDPCGLPTSTCCESSNEPLEQAGLHPCLKP